MEKRKWRVSRPYDNKLDVINDETGKIICTIDANDYPSMKEAQTMAECFCLLPEILSVKNISQIAHLLNDK